MWDWFVKRGWASRGLRLAQTREINPSYRLKVVGGGGELAAAAIAD